MSDGVRFPKVPCLNCKKPLSAAMDPRNPQHRPRVGDVTVCLYCGHLMAFDIGMAHRELTDSEIRDVAGNPDVLAIQRARGATMKGSKPQ